MKKVTLFKDGDNFGAVFYDGNKRTEWEDLTRTEQIELLNAMVVMRRLFERFLKEEGGEQ